MAGGYLVSEEEHTQDVSQVTEPQQLSIDSPCGAALLPLEPMAEEVIDNQE